MSEENGSANVKTMLGDPRKAIFALSIPLAVALFVQQSNNLVDSLWVTSLGGASMAAIGLVNPIYSVIIGIGNGLGIGAAAVIARNIGQGNREDANKAASQAILLIVIVAIIFTPLFLFFAEPMLVFMGAGDTISTSLQYAYPIYSCAILFFLSSMISALLRGEGDNKRSMYVQVLAAGVNFILDPIFIYVLDMGVAGAAWATIIACSSSIVLGMYWYLVKKDLYITLRLKHLRFDREIQGNIVSIGFPQALELSVMNLFNIIYNYYIIMIGSTDVMAIYTVIWRILYMLLIPAQAMGGAIISACSAEFGMKRYDMIHKAYMYCVRSSIIWLTILMVLLMVFADPISSVFTSAPDMQYLHDEMVRMTWIFAIFLPFMSLVFVGGSLLQSINRSKIALYSSIIRNVILAGSMMIVAYTIGTMTALWWMYTVAEIVGGLLMGYWAYVILKGVAQRDGYTIKRTFKYL